MKIKVLSLFVVLLLVACKNENNSESKPENLKPSLEENVVKKTVDRTLKGEFIYSNGAAVLKGRSAIYGIVLDEQGLALKEAVDEVKNDEYDMIPVLIQGKIIKNPDDGWEHLVEVTKIIKIDEPQPNENIIIESAN
ncbi:MAG: hypothetical protein LAT51_04275 [Flavobacteriaceae bacterium]|nr:hypothetical protein [Flavobacteriaceae bacterium]